MPDLTTLMPTSTTNAPGMSMSPVMSPADPAAVTTTSARFTSAARFARSPVANGDRAVLTNEQQLNRLADDIAAPDYDGPLPFEVVAIRLGYLDRGLGTGGQEAFVAERHQARVERVDAVDVLGRQDRVGDRRQRDVPRQRLLDDDPGYLVVRC